MLADITNFLVDSIGSAGYLGIFALMFLESTFFPFPSEVVMIPAGYLSFKGEMNLFVVIIIGTLGSLAGALCNYYLSKFLGRKMLLKYGKYVFFDASKMSKLESFFDKHGDISTFNGRLIPGIRQYISLPAGLARMNIYKFSLYTTLGAAIWVSILAVLGYFIGDQQELASEYLHTIIIATLVVLVGFTLWYLKRR